MIWKAVKTKFAFSNILLLLLFACQTSIPEPTITTLPPTNTIAPSQTPSPQITHTNTPTKIPPTLTPLPTNTPVPTLPVAEQDAYVIDLIVTNGGCELPCLLGIQPGVSTWLAVRDLVEPFWDQSRLNPGDTTLRYGFPHSFMGTNIQHFSMGVYGVNDSIEYISTSARIYLPSDSCHSRPFAKAMQSYSLQAILKQYGAPSRVLLYLVPSHDGGGDLLMQLITIYENQNFLIHYFIERGISSHPDTLKRIVCPWWNLCPS